MASESECRRVSKFQRLHSVARQRVAHVAVRVESTHNVITSLSAKYVRYFHVILSCVGTQGTFLAYGVTCIIVFVGYFVLNFFYVSKQPLPPPHDDAGTGQTESVYLAPHGVPGGIPRSPSKAKGQFTSCGLLNDRLLTQIFCAIFIRNC